MSIEALQKELEKEREKRLAAEAKIVSLNHEIDAFQKVLLLRSQNSAHTSSESDIILAHLINNVNDGIVIEDEQGKVQQINEKFCRLFGIDQEPERLRGSIYLNLAERGKQIFKNPDAFVARISQLVNEKKITLNEELRLKDDTVYTFDYVPIFAEGKYKGHLWKYSSVSNDSAANNKLESQKKFYEQILDNIPADIAVYGKDHKYLYVNPNSIANPELRKWTMGKPDEEYCQHTGKPAAITESRKKLFNKVKTSRKQSEWEEKIKKAGGSIEYHLRKMIPVTDDNGDLGMVISYGQNITEQKKVEENLKLSDKRYREIFSFSQAWICTHDMDGLLLSVNPTACKILGYEERELVGMSIDTLMPEKMRETFNEIYLTQIKNEGKSEGVMHILNREGKNIYLLYQNYQVNEAGYEPYVIGFAQNITERLQAEDALKRSEEKYRGIIDNMNLGMLELDNNEQIIYANQRFCTMSGYAQAELITQNARELFLDNVYTRNISERMLKRQFSIANSYELAIKNKKGESKWWLVSNAPLYNADGSLKGSVSIHLDISRQKKLEHQLRDAKLEAERSAAAKEMFLTNMSHEIRTPINAIMGLGKLLGKSGGLDEQQQYYLTSIRAASENLLVIINDILDLAKIEAGKINIESMSFDLKKITAQAMTMLTHKAEEKGLEITHEIDARIAPKLIGDPYRINQVFINMLSNAIKFTEKGSVELKATLLEEDASYQKILVTIKDTGVGISEEFLRNIFKKFTQEDETVARKFGGTGLGMSITKQLMELMEGSIDITSRKGAGTLVSLEFKFRIGSEKVLEKKRAINKTDTSNIKDSRVLLVEDNELNRLLANTILKQFGADVDEAENGAIAVDMMRQKKYNIILMDVQMPVMDGVTATQIIRKEISKSIPIIALTANAIKGKREEYIQAGMNDCMTKPYDEEKMVSLVSHWLNMAATQKGRVLQEKVAAPTTESEFIDYFESAEVPEPKVKAIEIPDNEPLYDVKKLTGMGGGNNDFVMQMLKLFVTNTPESAQKIKSAYASGDFDTVKYLAHLIRPSLHNMSVNSVKNDVLQIEALAEKKIKDPMLEMLIDKLITVVDKAVGQIKKEFSL